ncbi:hypothetical protein PRZ48_014541 [Zasmidium cellare]|uniref:Cytochrome P450 n=1 Tax=Zasmidium cellare TaxID=395010 RepID=A0ABR0DZ24_ZASCE|nr:hypothetical protein PRZ48_014541 [Zasmidium cellare]
MSTASYVQQNGHDLSTLLSTLALIAASAIVLYIISIFKTAFFGPLSHFPGPRLRAISKLPGIYTSVKGREAITRVALHDRYGPMVRVNPNELSYSGGAEAWAAIYGSRKQDDRPHKDPMFYVVGVNGVPDLSSADFSTHTRQRKILSLSFSDKSLRDFEPIIRSWAVKMVKKLSNKHGTSIDMMTYLNCTTFDIMGDLTFNEDLKMLENEELSHWVKTIFGGFKAGTFWRGIRQLSTFSDWTVRKLLFGSKKVRLMHPVDVRAWSKADESSVGSETTATALSGMTYLLHLPKNKTSLESLKEDVRGSFTGIQDMTFENLARLKCLQAVIQESLRIYPPIRKTFDQNGGSTTSDTGTIILMQWSRFQSVLRIVLGRFDLLPNMTLFNLLITHVQSLAYHEMRFLLASLVLNFDIELLRPTEDWLDQETHILWEKKPLMCVLRRAEALD